VIEEETRDGGSLEFLHRGNSLHQTADVVLGGKEEVSNSKREEEEEEEEEE
jgi:hypothetical protein